MFKNTSKLPLKILISSLITIQTITPNIALGNSSSHLNKPLSNTKSKMTNDTNHENIEQLLEISHKLINNNDSIKALSILNKIISERPKCAMAYFYKSEYYANNANYNESIFNLNKSIELNPKNKNAYLARAWSYYYINDPSKAKADLNKYLALDSHSCNALTLQASLDIEENKPAKALKSIDKALTINSRYAPAYIVKSRVYKAQNKYTKAMAQVNKAISIDPGNTDAYTQRVELCDLTNDFNQEFDDLGKIVKLNPKDAKTYKNLANFLYNFNDFDAAISCYQKSIQINPKDISCYYSLGNSMESKLKYDEAIKAYSRGLALNPLNAELKSTKACVEALNNNFKDAYQDIHEVVLKSANNPYVNFNQGLIDFLAGDFKTPISEFTLAGKTKWRFQLYSKILAYALSCLENEKDSSDRVLASINVGNKNWPDPIVKYYKSEVNVNQLFASVNHYFNLSEGHFYTGLKQLAIGNKACAYQHFKWVSNNGARNNLEFNWANYLIAQAESRNQKDSGQVNENKWSKVWLDNSTDFDQAIKECPDDPVTYVNRGQYYFSQNNYPACINDCTTALSLNPKDPIALYTLSKVYTVNKEYEKAISNLDSIISTMPDFSLPYAQIGEIYDQKKDLTNAIKYYALATNSNPGSYDYNLKLATAYFDNKEYSKALNYYSRLTDLYTLKTSDYEKMAQCFARLNQYKQAYEMLLKAYSG